MEQHTGLSRRGRIRLISFTVALIAALTVSTIGGYMLARTHRTAIEYGYQRALGELTEYIGNIHITLEKGQYATSPNQLEGLSSKLWREAGYAKNTLEQLPADEGELRNTYRFLSQVGNFCVSLSRRVTAGEPIREEENAALEQLMGYAAGLYDRLVLMQSQLEAGELQLGETQQVMAETGEEETAPDVNSGFHDMEEGFEDYPTLIYDGPFSDHIQQQQPKSLKGASAVTEDEARKAADKLVGAPLSANGEVSGNLPSYVFSGDNLYVRVTKDGGKIAAFLNSRVIEEAHYSADQALQKGKEALRQLGYADFVYRYYSINNGVMTINFAATQDGVVLYADLVKVGIAMDTGEMVSLDAQGYIMNHTPRSLPEIRVKAEEAAEKLSRRLTRRGEARLALIPDEGLSETLCHEFTCTGIKGETVLVYVNVETGMEEQILIVLEDETGVLTM